MAPNAARPRPRETPSEEAALVLDGVLAVSVLVDVPLDCEVCAVGVTWDGY